MLIISLWILKLKYSVMFTQGRSQGFLKGVSKNSIGLPEQGSGGQTKPPAVEKL